MTATNLNPASRLHRLLSNRLVRRLHRRHIRNRDVRIMSGIGQGLYFNPGDSSPTYVYGTNEQPVQQALAQNLQPGDVFYDIGANIGFFSVLGALLVGTDGKVMAFEPVPENAALIQKNCDLNGFDRVVVWETAVTDSIGTGELQLAHHSGGASLVGTAPPPDFKGTLSVPLVTLDDLIFAQGLPVPDLIKIDVEGAEINVLRGMQKTLQQYQTPIIFEIDDNNADAFSAKEIKCTQFLQAFNYEIVPLEDSYPDYGWIVGNFFAQIKEM